VKVVLSLCDGMSCGRIALSVAGKEVTRYYASEIDVHAIKVTRAIWPMTIQLGDMQNWREWDIDWASINLLIGGTPCQGFSFAGKQLAFDDPRSKLFFVYADILNYIKTLNPNVKFMLENVRMKKEYLAVISEQLGVEPVFINSALVSAQNRRRFYWANWKIEQPEEKGILLADILESEGFGVIKDQGELKPKNDKSQCIDANYHKGADNHGQRTVIFNFEHNNNHILSEKAMARIERKKYSKPQVMPNKTGTLNTKNNSGQLSMDSGTTLIPVGLKYRKLTPRECGRLQTVPEPILDVMLNCGVSNTQLYKMFGNGMTIDVLAHNFSTMEM
jgi:DNA-cytosine methyltransferase